MAAARERAKAASMQGGMNLLMLTQCHFEHNLGNAIGTPNSSNLGLSENARRQCTEVSKQSLRKISDEKIPPQRAGLMLCTALNSGTEFQRIVVAKGHNLENAKKIEEMKVAEINRSKGYRRSGGMSR